MEAEIDQGEPTSKEDAENGETLLWKLYTGPGGKVGVIHTSSGPRRSISTGTRNCSRRQTQAVNPMPHNGGSGGGVAERKSRSSGRKSSSPPELPAIQNGVRKAYQVGYRGSSVTLPSHLMHITYSMLSS